MRRGGFAEGFFGGVASIAAFLWDTLDYLCGQLVDAIRSEWEYRKWLRREGKGEGE